MQVIEYISLNHSRILGHIAITDLQILSVLDSDEAYGISDRFILIIRCIEEYVLAVLNGIQLDILRNSNSFIYTFFCHIIELTVLNADRRSRRYTILRYNPLSCWHMIEVLTFSLFSPTKVSC